MGRSTAGELKEVGYTVTTKRIYIPVVKPEFIDPELSILATCVEALECLDPDASFRAAKYLWHRFNERLLDSQWDDEDIAETVE